MTPHTVLVTGANSGLGLSMAVELARRGHRTIGTVRSSQKAGELREAAEQAGTEVETALLDVTDAERCAAVIDRFRPDVLVNNAGYGLSAPIEAVADEDAEQLLATMLVAPVRLARLALPHMRTGGLGTDRQHLVDPRSRVRCRCRAGTRPPSTGSRPPPTPCASRSPATGSPSC